MTRNEKIQHEIQKTLDSADHIEPQKTDAFFYTRLQARIDAIESSANNENGWDLFLRILKPGLLIVLIAANIFTAYAIMNKKADNGAARTRELNAFAREMTLDSNQYNPTLIVVE